MKNGHFDPFRWKLEDQLMFGPRNVNVLSPTSLAPGHVRYFSYVLGDGLPSEIKVSARVEKITHGPSAKSLVPTTWTRD